MINPWCMFLLTMGSLSNICASMNNVCKNWKDYDTIEANANCSFNPDVYSSLEQIVKRKGFSLRQYEVETLDGYILTLFRIGNKEDIRKLKQPVFMLHGLLASADFWVVVSDRSLAFTLVESGYDVWIGSIRGTKYGSRHRKYTMSDKQFWDYSIDEIGKYDVPAQLKFVHKETDLANKIVYIGHSLGTSAGFMYMITNKNEAKKYILSFYALSPSAYYKDMTFLQYIIPLLYPGSLIPEKTYASTEINAILNPTLSKNTFVKFCTKNSFNYQACFFITQILFGFDLEQKLPEDFPLVLTASDFGFSLKEVYHYIQLSGSERFQKFDFGKNKNLLMYGSLHPPVYDLSKIDRPVHFYVGASDALTTVHNVKRMYEDITSRKTLRILTDNGPYYFNHADWIFAKDVQDAFITPFMADINSEFASYKLLER